MVLAGLAMLVVAIPPGRSAGHRVKLTGEVIDSWCQTTGIMYALGTAHHQCAVWCAVGGIPVGLRTQDGTLYTILKVDKDKANVANPRLLRLQTHEVSVEGDLIERDGLRYLLIDQVMDDHGIVNQTHADYAIQPFGE
ncbi:hypothetical protein CU669_02180 [Paramagnetospirillum kuznetsovii]|uniref:Uncharacterized protein n=2 Tax=Paramagnetospirillum kuznetsovii TaxID=2053833 RepID=A0A364P3M7_9PROT|nr:hypothetical protein CU669_02180 [Paramagnetospirillum kuznetsovii]